MESIRGVDVGGVLGTLLERNLITIKGRSKGPGRPLLYRTTAGFLDHFGLNNLEDLPSLEELESLLAKRDEEAAEDVPVGVAPAGVEDEAGEEVGSEEEPETAGEAPGQRVDGQA
jgi:segregation and condensation protein B